MKDMNLLQGRRMEISIEKEVIISYMTPESMKLSKLSKQRKLMVILQNNYIYKVHSDLYSIS